MSERKPPGTRWESWVEDKIREAQAAGGFEKLEGHSKPIPGLDAPYDPLWWVKKLLEREKLSVLPLALEVRAQVDRALETVWSLPRDAQVRERVAAVNAAIARANRTTSEGPPTTLAPLDVGDVLAEWRRRRGGRTR
jgi:DnaJ homologue, subfamily C, member 28, conserved domain